VFYLRKIAFRIQNFNLIPQHFETISERQCKPMNLEVGALFESNNEDANDE
jgi:hypothetical protein